MSSFVSSWTLLCFITVNLFTLLLSIGYFFIERRKSDNAGGHHVD